MGRSSQGCRTKTEEWWESSDAAAGVWINMTTFKNSLALPGKTEDVLHYDLSFTYVSILERLPHTLTGRGAQIYLAALLGWWETGSNTNVEPSYA